MKVAELSLSESHHFSRSRACWNVESASRSREHRDFVPGLDGAPTGSTKELAPSSTSLLRENLSSASLCPTKISPPALVDTTKDVLEVLVYHATIPPPAFKIFDFEKTEYRADVLNADYPAQGGRPTDLDHVEKLRNMVREGR